MAITGETKVISCNVRWPLRLYGRTIYRLITDVGDFVSVNPPVFFDQTGQPVALSAELAADSLVRVQHDGHGIMTAVQLIDVQYGNPFARLVRSMRAVFTAVCRAAFTERRVLTGNLDRRT
jgi:hypothetical protein